MRARQLALAAVFLLLPLRAVAEIRLIISGGQVSLSARNATLAQILAEWAKAGPTRIVNGERVTGAPLTMELVNVTEVQALDILLRSTGGYLVAPRPGTAASGSKFDRVLILPVAAAPRAAMAAAPVAQGTFPRPMVAQPARPAPEEVDAAQPDAVAPPAAPPDGPRGPVFQTFPVPRGQGDRTPPAVAPVGVPIPGMVPIPTPPPSASSDPADATR